MNPGEVCGSVSFTPRMTTGRRNICLCVSYMLTPVYTTSSRMVSSASGLKPALRLCVSITSGAADDSSHRLNAASDLSGLGMNILVLSARVARSFRIYVTCADELVSRFVSNERVSSPVRSHTFPR